MAIQEIKKILDSDDPEALKAFFVFDSTDSDDRVILKFNLWARKFFPKYFSSRDANFHREIDEYNLECYRRPFVFVDIAFRGAAKSVRTKLFFSYAVANDLDHYRRYIRVLAEDGNNSKQIITDIYNIFVNRGVAAVYPEIFQKSSAKREETMTSFTTATGVKMFAGTVGTDQRGALQEEARPDLIWFEDFENRKTLRSAVKTKAIWDNMEEARTGLSKDGSCIYTCNYVSEAGNVHKLVTKQSENKKVLIVPIITPDGKITWPYRYNMDEINNMRKNDDDFEGERLCEPSASKDILFDRPALDRQKVRLATKESAGVKIFEEFDPSHEYAGGQDVAGGVGLDSSASVIIDFSTIPAQVVASYQSNTIKPEAFGYEVQRQSEMYGGCLMAPENNNKVGGITITTLKMLEVPMFEMRKNDRKVDDKDATEFGWETNQLTKPKMILALQKALKEGLLILNDVDILNEAKSYTKNDLIENVRDPRLTTRHFDLLTACAIAWQMKDHRLPSVSKNIQQVKAARQRRRERKPFHSKYGG